MLKFSDECAAIEAQSLSRHQKLVRSFNKCFSIQKQNGILVKILLFLSAGVFQTHIFQIALCDFRQESGFLAVLTVEKGQGLFFTSKKRERLIFDFLKRAGHIFDF